MPRLLEGIERPDIDQRRDAWAAYWESGALASLQGAARDNYQAAPRAWWLDFLGGLPDRSRILDIGTGNGAVAQIAAEFSREHDTGFRIHGIDLAPIDPVRALGDRAGALSDVSFHPSTPAEDTGFEAGHFDAVTGQYALEYTVLDRSVPELARITAPGAELCFVLHCYDSVVVDRMRQQMQQARRLFEETRLFTHARRLFEALGGSHEERRLAQFRKQASVILEHAGASDNPALYHHVLDGLGRLYEERSRLNRQSLLQRLDGLEAGVRANVDRLRDLAGVMLTRTDLEAMVRSFEHSGFRNVESGTLREGNDVLLGWTLRAQRAD